MRHSLLTLISICLLSCSDKPQQKQSGNPAATAEHLLYGGSLETSLFKTAINGKNATVGVAVKEFESGDEHYILGEHRFAMMSVAKFPQALALLSLADSGKYDLTKPISFGPADLKQRTGSSILKDHPQSSFSLSFPEVLRYSIGQSDNITSNKIFKLEGGPKAVEAYVYRLGIRDIGIATDYAHMSVNGYQANWCAPRAIMQLLEKFYRGQLISENSKALLWKAMLEATSGPDRIKGLLPPGTPVVHKTGTSSRDSATGIAPATNDVGIVQLPDGRHFGIAVFVADSKEADSVNAGIIARISKATWDYYLKK